MKEIFKYIIFGLFAILFGLAIGFSVYYFVLRKEPVQEVEKSKEETKFKKPNANGCFSNDLEYKRNQYIYARIVDLETNKFTNKRIFTTDELVDYGYGFEIKNAPTGYYIEYEICNLQTLKTLSYPKMFKSRSSWHEKDSHYAGDGWSDREITDFAWESINGQINTPMKEPGKYAIDVYAASEESDWEWVDRLEFEVK